ncbi:MAG: YegS/Rv2252/BmrU family lipid kinase [Bacteroidaceae bacterium]|nr:YegS/Rv2252/BmrU family lipid kinase [Bacteroidaceae bacterium]
MSGKKKIWFIVNPISGTKSKAGIVAAIHKYMPPDRFDAEIRYTQRKGHAAQIAAEAIGQDVDIVVAVGGDGTVNETARALIHTNVALGIVPCGSGNGLARHLCLPMNPEKALSVISECNIHSLDYGLINGQPFFCTAGVGFDAFLSDKFNKSGHRGLLSYVENALKVGVTYKPETYELEINGGVDTEDCRQVHKAFLITCANASQYGNDFYIAPHASMSDGLMDVTVMEPFTLLEAPAIAYQLAHRTITSNSHIRTFKCKSLTIHRQQPGVIHYDGDPKDEAADVRVELVPGDIRMVVNVHKKPRR